MACKKNRRGNSLNRSEIVHDFMACLAKSRITLSESKTLKINKFIYWIEREIIKGSIDKLKDKENIRGFHNGNLNSLIDSLKKNQILPKLMTYGDKRFEALESAFTKEMAEIEPIKEQMAFTDNLIDQIVYVLYALTEDQIAIIEGNHIY